MPTQRVEIINAKLEDWSAAYAGEKFHAVLSDPPYGLEFMGEDWDAPHKAARPDAGNLGGFADGNKPSFARQRFRLADSGICQLCGVDCEKQKRIFRASGEGAVVLRKLWELGINARFKRHFFEIDHILPIVEGGALCDWDNLRTLCLVCHHRVTAELKARMAKEKRRAKKFAQEPLWREDAEPEIPRGRRPAKPLTPVLPLEPEPF